ncbi:MAG: hypothetical protein JXX28_00960 [Deltaproteobacteria bacterium]|nr:hypothetical protein [Deltaproteobacteria bacterium]
MSFTFDNQRPTATVVRSLHPLVIERPRSPVHIHSYGGETPFFEGLGQGRLMATRCDNPACTEAGAAGYLFCPPRVHCPDCLERMTWVDITDGPARTAKVHTHICVLHPGAFNRLPTPSKLISVEMEGVITTLMSHMRVGVPVIGMELEPVFNTSSPTFTILDLSWRQRRAR